MDVDADEFLYKSSLKATPHRLAGLIGGQHTTISDARQIYGASLF